MDINELLNQIIFKYNLDRHYPHYRNMYEAKKLLCKVINEIKVNGQNTIFVGNDETGMKYIRKIANNYAAISFLSYKKNDLNQLATTDFKVFKTVYLVSFYGAEYIARWFRKHNIHYVWIYDLFEKNGWYLQKEFSSFNKEEIRPLWFGGVDGKGWKNNLQMELYFQKSTYENTDDCEIQHIALEKCLFLTLYMKNFVEAKRYIDLLSKDSAIFEELWNEIQNLLDEIKEAIRERNKKDIVLYWLDCLPFGATDNMPYLTDMISKSVAFNHAYTCTPYTHATMRAMFLNKREVDDLAYKEKHITRENSPVIQFLEERGYGIRATGLAFSLYFLDQYQSGEVSGPGDAFSMNIWAMLQNMLLEKKETLWLVHSVEAHAPYMSCGIDDSNIENEGARCVVGREEIDKQLAFYDEFLGGEVYRIYMSDHGPVASFANRYRILFNIYHKDLAPKKIDSLFSILDFGKVIKQVILYDSINEKEISREYVDVQDIDYYNRDVIELRIKNKGGLFLRDFGYKGIIDKKYIYIKFKIGQEWLVKRDGIMPEPYLFNNENPICDPDVLANYRTLAGEYPEYIDSDEKFKYSKYLYKLYYNALKYNNDSVKKRFDMINQLLERYPNNSVAIRGGGGHSAVLYGILSEKNKKKIWGFIDGNDQCNCKRFNLQIVGDEVIGKLNEMGIKAVMLSSYNYLNAYRDEIKRYPSDVDVLDIYKCFEENGVQCKGCFYDCCADIPDEAYEVGFPFDEV